MHRCSRVLAILLFGLVGSAPASAGPGFLVHDIHPTPGADAIGHYTSFFHTFDGAVYFTADDGTNGRSLWRSDGTGPGTEIVAPGAQIQLAESIGDRLYFVSFVADFRLWSLEGSTAAPFGGLGVVDELAALGETLVLSAGYQGQQLWRLDTTVPETAAPEMVVDLNPEWTTGCLVTPPSCGHPFPSLFTVAGGELYFIASENGLHPQLWVSDATTAGTRLLRTFDIGENPVLAKHPVGLIELDGRLFFMAFEAHTGWSLWSSDGSGPGTTLLQSFPSENETSRPIVAGIFRRSLIVHVRDPNGGDKLWLTDGTDEGTVLLLDLDADGTSFLAQVVADDERIFFAASTEATGREPWVSDGTPEGTHLLRDILPGPGSSQAWSFSLIDGHLVFSADDTLSGHEPWWSDGTAEGTLLLDDVAPGPASSSPTAYTALGSLVYFAADDGNGRELWAFNRSDVADWRIVRLRSQLPVPKKPKTAPPR